MLYHVTPGTVAYSLSNFTIQKQAYSLSKFYTVTGTFIYSCLSKDNTRELNPLRPNNDLSQTSHCNIKGVSVSEVMRIENKITPVKFY